VLHSRYRRVRGTWMQPRRQAARQLQALLPPLVVPPLINESMLVRTGTERIHLLRVYGELPFFGGTRINPVEDAICRRSDVKGGADEATFAVARVAGSYSRVVRARRPARRWRRRPAG